MLIFLLRRYSFPILVLEPWTTQNELLATECKTTTTVRAATTDFQTSNATTIEATTDATTVTTTTQAPPRTTTVTQAPTTTTVTSETPTTTEVVTTTDISTQLPGNAFNMVMLFLFK